MTATVEREAAGEGVVLLRLNRPEVLNAIDTRLGQELLTALTALAADDAVRVVVLTGAGDRAFSVGADLKERLGMSDETWAGQHRLFRQAFAALAGLSCVTIAAVNGLAFGGGLELALACDFAYAVDTARFALPEVKRGIMPGAGGTQRLARLVGEARAKELILSGDSFDAAEALRWGVVNRVLPPGRLQPEVLAVAGRIAANAPLALRAAKQAIRAGLDTDLASGLLIEVLAHQRLALSEDRREGIAAFNEKRTPAWKGR